MDLPLDPTVPLGGIALILALVWLTGGRRQAVVTGAAATALLAAPETGFAAEETALSQDGRALLARDGDGRIAVAFASGAHLAVRRLAPGDIAAVTLERSSDGNGSEGGDALLHIRTRAFTHRDYALRLAHDEAARWRGHLERAA